MSDSDFDNLYHEYLLNQRKLTPAVTRALCKTICEIICEEESKENRQKFKEKIISGFKETLSKDNLDACEEILERLISTEPTEERKTLGDSLWECLYDKLYEESDEGDIRRSLWTKSEKALERAHDNRKFEIGLYWQRNLYFWGFQVAIMAGTTLILPPKAVTSLSNAVTTVSNTVITTQNIISPEPQKQITSLLETLVNTHDYMLALAFATLGVIITIAWYYLSQGAKAWQENWEAHIDNLEYPTEGNLYRTIVGDVNKFYSVSKVNQFVIYIIGIFWSFVWAFIWILIVHKWSPDAFEIFMWKNLFITMPLLIIVAGSIYLHNYCKTSFDIEKSGAKHGIKNINLRKKNTG